MKVLKLICLFVLFSAPVWGQGDYLVTTTSQKSVAGTAEERFVEDNFRFYSLCNWTPGMKFMYIIEEKFNFIPTFSDYKTETQVDNNFFHHKIMVFEGVEERENDKQGRSFVSTRFVFSTNGEKYYHEIKSQRLNEICIKSPRSYIKGLVYLDDIDKARSLLLGRTVYTKVKTLRVDDANSANGYREITSSDNDNKAVRINAIGVGSREAPVKIVLADNEGRTYFVEVALSTTNTGYVKSDFQGEQRSRFFPNVLAFADANVRTQSGMKSAYMNKYIYPVVHMEAKLNGRITTLYRFTPLLVVGMDIATDNDHTILKLQAQKGDIYEVPVRLKYDVITKNDDFIEDLFAAGNLRAQYSYITDKNWQMIVNGEIALGMTRDECRLSLGAPIQRQSNMNSRYETWFYQSKTLDFEDGKLIKMQ